MARSTQKISKQRGRAEVKTKLFHVTVHWPQQQDYWGDWVTIVNLYLVYCKNQEEAKNLVADRALSRYFNWDITDKDVRDAGLNIDCVEVEGVPVTANNHVIFVKSRVE